MCVVRVWCECRSDVSVALREGRAWSSEGDVGCASGRGSKEKGARTNKTPSGREGDWKGMHGVVMAAQRLLLQFKPVAS
jgi:hypothetical protein